mmetsp:Transcript_13761/g.29243  ORF Transcript_13761/g.29243 Transcript_13761/m.29243 type:complete len:259 (+) Transcript_13761:398-1174(+)
MLTNPWWREGAFRQPPRPPGEESPWSARPLRDREASLLRPPWPRPRHRASLRGVVGHSPVPEIRIIFRPWCTRIIRRTVVGLRRQSSSSSSSSLIHRRWRRRRMVSRSNNSMLCVFLPPFPKLETTNAPPRQPTASPPSPSPTPGRPWVPPLPVRSLPITPAPPRPMPTSPPDKNRNNPSNTPTRLICVRDNRRQRSSSSNRSNHNARSPSCPIGRRCNNNRNKLAVRALHREWRTVCFRGRTIAICRIRRRRRRNGF